MNTVTKFVMTAKQARELAGDIFEAADKAENEDEVQHVSTNVEQSEAEGPWRLTLHIVSGY